MSKSPIVQESRRRLIKAVAGSGGIIVGAKVVPREWTKPVVDSVILPAHAQASPVERIYAEALSNGGGFCVTLRTDGTADVVMVEGGRGMLNPRGFEHFRWDGTIPGDGSIGTIRLTQSGTNCTGGMNFLVSRQATVNNITDTSLDFNHEIGSGGFINHSLSRVQACPSFTVTDCVVG